MVPVSVTLLIPVPRPDAAATGDKGRSFARDLLAELQLTLGGVPVIAKPAST